MQWAGINLPEAATVAGAINRLCRAGSLISNSSIAASASAASTIPMNLAGAYVAA
jgi:hypothetical protein